MKAIYDVESLFSRLLVVGQQRSIDIADVFQFELNPVPPALIDKYGCLRKGGKAELVKSLSVSVTTLCAPNVVLIDAGQLLYHVIWPVSGTTRTRMAHYPTTQLLLKIDKRSRGDPGESGAKQYVWNYCHVRAVFGVILRRPRYFLQKYFSTPTLP